MRRWRIDRLTGPPVTLVDDAGLVVAARCHRADTRRARAVGLLATPDLARDEALWLESCASVHTLGMRIALGVAFIDRAGRVLRVIDPMPPGRCAWVRGAAAAVECRPGVLQPIAAGSVLRLRAR